MANNKEGGQASKPSPTVGGSAQDLYDVSDIRFVMRAVDTLTERIANNIDMQKGVEARAEKKLEKLDQRFDKLEELIKTTAKPISDDVDKLKSQATYFKGYMAALFLVGGVVAFFFHDQLQHIADSVAKLGK